MLTAVEFVREPCAGLAAALDVSEDADPMEVPESWALEVKVARWESSARNEPCDSPLARVLCVLGTGGPHVEIEISYSASGGCESVELRRYWSGQDAARTEDPRALDIASAFVATFVAEG